MKTIATFNRGHFFATHGARKAELVKLRFFAGLPKQADRPGARRF